MKFAYSLVSMLSVSLLSSAGAQIKPVSYTFHAVAQSTKPSKIGLIRMSRTEREDLLRQDHRVLLNVTVTDASGKPVSGLGEKDFTILDHDKPQSIATLQEVQGRSSTGRAHIVLLIDAVNNSFADVARERRAVDAFLRRNGGTLSYPVSLAMLSDSGVRKTDASTNGNLLADRLRDQFPRPGRFSLNGGPSGGNQRFLLSIQALRRLAADERDEPGRAILIWMGQGWPTLTDPGYEAATFEDKKSYFDALVQLSTTLRMAQVTINNVLPVGFGHPSDGVDSSKVRGIRHPEEAEAEDLSLASMVQITGGKSLHQGTDSVAAIAACAVDAESYYRLSFDPQAASGPNELRFLTVKLDKPELVLRTYKLYYAQP